MMAANPLKEKTVLITGASSGIGKACAALLAQNGYHIIITARRMDRLELMACELKEKYSINCLPLLMDVQNRNSVEKCIQTIDLMGIDVDILVNNAGLALGTVPLQEGLIEEWETMIDTNIKGLLYVTRSVLPLMLKKKSGHIINIGSIAAHSTYAKGNVYCATKHAVKALSDSLRQDLLGTKIKVTEIDPGAVETEFSEVRFKDKEKAKKFYEGFEPLIGADVADAILYCITRPFRVNIAEMVIFPQAQASLTEIYREGEVQKDFFGQLK